MQRKKIDKTNRPQGDNIQLMLKLPDMDVILSLIEANPTGVFLSRAGLVRCAVAALAEKMEQLSPDELEDFFLQNKKCKVLA